jgi:hypothetical protein
MNVSILRGLAAEWALLHQVDERWFKFETTIPNVHLRTSPNIGIRWSREIVDALPGSHQCRFMWQW